MKLFFELVSCYWGSSAPREEEPMSLQVAPGGRGKRGRRRDRESTFRQSEWKPSLCTISEEKLVAVVMDKDDEDNQTVRSRGSVWRTSGSRSSRSHRDDFGRSPSAVVIPPFTPLPFLF